MWEEYRDNANRHSKLETQSANLYRSAADNIVKENEKMADEVSSSTLKSAKYLWNQRKKKKG